MKGDGYEEKISVYCKRCINVFMFGEHILLECISKTIDRGIFKEWVEVSSTTANMPYMFFCYPMHYPCLLQEG